MKTRDERMKEMFTDYQPKESEDTADDYLTGKEKADYNFFVQMLPKSEIANLQNLLELLESHKITALRNPGAYVQGNVILGADEREYVPSLDELKFAAVGKWIRQLVSRNAQPVLEKYLTQKGIRVRKVEVINFTFRHVDVMGSGRFFYASAPQKEIIHFY